MNTALHFPCFDISVVVGPCLDRRIFHRTFNGLFLHSCSKINVYLGIVAIELSVTGN